MSECIRLCYTTIAFVVACSQQSRGSGLYAMTSKTGFGSEQEYAYAYVYEYVYSC